MADDNLPGGAPGAPPMFIRVKAKKAALVAENAKLHSKLFLFL